MLSNLVVPEPILLSKSQTLSVPFYPLTPGQTKKSKSMAEYSPTSSESTPVKRKRGRPPKADSLSNRITSTMNINVNTSPLSNSPSAESNSNLVSKRNNPEYYTSILKVSPSKLKRKSRKNSNQDLSNHSSPSGMVSPSKKFKANPVALNDNLLVTPLQGMGGVPMSTPFHQINAKTLDNISLITQADSGDNNYSVYNTPPSSTVRSQFGLQNSAGFVPNHFKSNSLTSFPTPTQSVQTHSPQHLVGSSMLENDLELNRNNLLPPVAIEKPKSFDKKKKQVKIKENSEPQDDRRESGFLLKLTIDDSGKAVLSNDFFQSLSNGTQKTEERNVKPRLTHSNSVIGIETQHFPDLKAEVELNEDQEEPQFHPNLLRRHNSDFTGVNAANVLTANEDSPDKFSQPQLPQTPKVKDNYLYSTGLTPSLVFTNNNLTFNLTPQFNSMMYSMMNINSPQLKRGMNNSQFLMNQEFFMNQNNQPQQSNNQHTVSMTDLMNLPNSNNHTMVNKPNMPEPLAMQNEHLSGTSSTSSSSQSEESGDARLALKKIIHVKRR